MDLIQAQTDIELSMATRGVDRYMRNAQYSAEKGEASRTASVQTVMDTALDSVAGAIEAFKQAALSGGAGRRHTAVKKIEGMDPWELAHITLRIILDGLAKDAPVASVSCTVGKAIEMEFRMAELEKSDGAYVRTLMKDLDKRTDHLRHRRAVLGKVLRERGDKVPSWGQTAQLHVGLKMLEIVVKSTGLMEVAMVRSGTKTTATLRATPRFREWLYALDTKLSLLSPEYLPCVIPPKDWTSPTEGGYHTDALAFPPKLVKTSNRDHHKLLAKAPMPDVYDAVNAIQRTPWQINSRVLEVAEQLIAELRPLAGLPEMDDVPLPTKPMDIDTNTEALNLWKRAAAQVYDSNRRVTGKRLGVLRNLHTAREFAHFERIYFPHQLDFRGRIYPIPQGLNPQGSDLGKALLHFAEGDRLDTVAAIRWFKVHGANCFGVDKVSFDDRMKWVDENAEHIIRTACDPIGYQWWAEADSPFCFLAWAFEFNDWVAEGCSERFTSRVPVAMDGSCNGLQHYSAMLRDPRAGAATNLTPSDKPQDIYAEVAKVVMQKLEAMGHARIAGVIPEGKTEEEAVLESVWAAKWWNFGIDRKITKRPVMVLPYGGTPSSCLEYVREAVLDRPSIPFTDAEQPTAISLLSRVVWESIGDVVISARLAMSWLKSAASKTAKTQAPLSWVTPCGFPVHQAYPEMMSERINSTLMGAKFMPRLDSVVEGKIDTRRQANGVAPNFVHSMDAAALVKAVVLALRWDCTKFAMIHDSYGTTAAKAATLAAALRQAFVDMYEEHDVLEQFAQKAVPEGIREELPGVPFVGGLDLQNVKSSLYFFA